MTMQQGSNTILIFGEETTYKTTPNSPSAQVLSFNSESLRLSRNLIESKAIRSNRNPQMPGRGNMDVTGDISFELSPYIGSLLKHSLGDVSTSGAEAPYTHTIKIGTLPTGMYIEKQMLDIPKYFLYNGCRVNSLKLGFKNEGIIEGSVSIIGAKETAGDASVDSSPADYGHAPFDGFEAAILEGGGSIANVVDVEITLDNNLDGSVYVIGGGGERSALPAGLTKVSGTVKAFFDSMTLYTKALNNTESSLQITLSRGTGLGTAGNESLDILISELKYPPNSPAIEGPQGVFVNLNFVGYYDNGAGESAIVMTLKNTQAAL